MKKLNRIIVTLLIAMLCVGVLLVPAMAATATNDCLEATLTTDKEVYAQDEQITATLVVKNTSDKTLENVSLKTAIPTGFAVAADSKDNLQAAQLAAGESLTLNVVYVFSNAPATGDQNGRVMAVVLMAVAVVGAVALCTRNKVMLSLALCLVLLGAVCVPAQAATQELTVEVSESAQETTSRYSETITLSFSASTLQVASSAEALTTSSHSTARSFARNVLKR